MKTGKKTTVALFVGNSNKLDNNANTLTASGAGIETDGAEATAKKYAVEVTPAAGCSACLVKDSIVTASWMTPKTANAADPFVVANNM